MKDEIISNGSKTFGENPDNIEVLFERLKKYTLEKFSGREKSVNKGRIIYLGNFKEVSAVFQIETDEGSKTDLFMKPFFKYRINDTNKINDRIIADEIFQEEKVDYTIKNREDLIDNLINWIYETGEGLDRDLMKEDLKYLISFDDKYILSSIQTNEYLTEDSEEGQEALKEIYNKLK